MASGILDQGAIGRLDAASEALSAGILPIVQNDKIESVTADQILLSAPVVRVAVVTATLAEINAGKVIVPALSGKSIVVTDFAARVSGNFTATTSVDLQATTTTATKVQVCAVAALTDAAVLKDGTANVTRGAAMYGSAPAGESISVANVGTAAAGGTSITFYVTYHYA